jgi:cell division protein FtsW
VTTADGHAARAASRSRPAARASLLTRPLASYYLLLSSTLLLVALGLFMVLSASSVTEFAKSGSSFTLFRKQLLWVGIALPLMWVAVHLPVRVFRRLAYPVLLGAVVLLIMVLVIGFEVDGATRWMMVGPFSVQPSEFAKLALALWGADLLARKAKLLHQWKHVFVPLLPVATLLALLIILEPDMGTMMALLCVVVGLLWVVGVPMRVFALLSAALVAILAGVAVSSPYRYDRITAWLDPEAHASNNAYQAIQARSRSRRAAGSVSGRGRAGRSGARCRPARPTTSSGSSARSSAWSAPSSWCCSSGCSPTRASGSRCGRSTRSAATPRRR